MVRPSRLGIALTLVVGAAAALTVAGPLNPPAGPIGSTYKTLSEVEPRIAISATNTPGDADSLFRITQPGSYYLTGDITGQIGEHGIEIDASAVTIDLSGFRLGGVTDSLAGIRINSGVEDVTIRNGSIRGWSAGGIDGGAASGTTAVEHVTVSQISGGSGIAVRGPATIVGCRVIFAADFGIWCPESASITNCSVERSGNDGFSVGVSASVTNCTSTSNDGEGFSSSGYCSFTGCTASYNDGVGILAGIGSLVSDCTAGNNADDGIRGLGDVRIVGCTVTSNLLGINTFGGCTIESCTASGNDTDGIRVTGSSSVLDSHCRGNGASGTSAGIVASGSGNRIDGNHCTDNDYGVRVTVLDNLVVRNSARNNPSGNFSFPSGAEYGQIITNPGAAFVATNPWANFAF